MLEKYEDLEIEIITFVAEDDIITTSVENGYDDDLDGEFVDDWE